MDYKQTLNLPKTEFSMQARLSQLEPRILRLWEQLDIYGLVQKKSIGFPKFILHDGPPYANGDIHIGHALNKILKDFVVKYKIMRGYNVPFIPGWDCHGLPVEHQLFKELGINKHQIDKVEFRKKAKAFALKFVNIQREQFKRLGLFSDWNNPYLTLDFSYESKIAQAFGQLVKSNYVYQGLKPVNWCINCETALSEAEVEYEDHRSPSIYVKFELSQDQKSKRLPRLISQLAGAQPIYFVIWTTTPWTLVCNVAIAVHPKFNYNLVKVTRKVGSTEILILAEQLVDNIMHQMGIENYEKLGKIKGKELEYLYALHPFLKRSSRLVLAGYVSITEGTGLVHIAPGHGQEDYLTGLKYKLPVIMPVDERGRFDRTFPDFFNQQVFQSNEFIIERLQGNKALLYSETTLHSYPHCWRCKTALITRSTKQWFINVDHKDLRKKALKAVRGVQWIPQAGASRISSMLQLRPDWCLSRQRLWGVPIPALYCRKCSQPILKAQIIEQFARIVLQEGSDSWFIRPAKEFLPRPLRCPVCRGEEFVKEEDIIDVWFDSGVSHQAVLAQDKALDFPANLYLEGSDQHRGWFQTSLLTSVSIAGQAPYRAVLTHGFVVDGEGKKMSKSRGNVISPQEIISTSGAEILRLWVASCNYADDVRISSQILGNISDAYRKIRNTLRFLLGNLCDYTPEKKIAYRKLEEIDRWALSCLMRLLNEVNCDYEHYRYHKVFRRIYNFCVNEMSSFYLDILKDRLYTFDQDSPQRRSAQTVICEILSTLSMVLTPLITFTAEEVWQRLLKILLVDSPLVLLNPWPKVRRAWIDPKLDKKIQRLIEIRNAALKAIEQQRNKGILGSSLEAAVLLYTTEAKLFRFLNENLDLLATIFIVSDVSVEQVKALPAGTSSTPDIKHLGISVKKVDYSKCQRCWNYRSSVGKAPEHPQLCQRCLEVIEQFEVRGNMEAKI